MLIISDQSRNNISHLESYHKTITIAVNDQILLYLLQIIGDSIIAWHVWFIRNDRRVWFWCFRTMRDVSNWIHCND